MASKADSSQIIFSVLRPLLSVLSPGQCSLKMFSCRSCSKQVGYPAAFHLLSQGTVTLLRVSVLEFSRSHKGCLSVLPPSVPFGSKRKTNKQTRNETQISFSSPGNIMPKQLFYFSGFPAACVFIV